MNARRKHIPEQFCMELVKDGLSNGLVYPALNVFRYFDQTYPSTVVLRNHLTYCKQKKQLLHLNFPKYNLFLNLLLLLHAKVPFEPKRFK